MSAAREKDQADFDLERFIDMFDEALTSQDPRVVNALRSLMMIVTLTRPESSDAGIVDRDRGPLRRLFEDMRHLNRRLSNLEDQVHSVSYDKERAYREAEKMYPNEKYALAQAQIAAQKMAAPTVQQVKGLTKK